MERFHTSKVGIAVSSDPHPLKQELVDAFFPATVSARKAGVHVFIVNGKTGDRWPQELGGTEDLPSWLAETPRPKDWDLSPLADVTMSPAEAPPLDRTLFSHRGECWSAVESSGGARLAYAEWGDQWQMLDVGLMLRAMGYGRVHVRYPHKGHLHPAGRGVELRVQRRMAELFGVVLDCGSHPTGVRLAAHEGRIALWRRVPVGRPAGAETGARGY